ncbi:MAG: response regulator [Planctomycetota bacterium]|nr:response regulator [Planctomycetota bacterium]
MSQEHERVPHILVIDDEESMRYAVARGIRRAGLASTEAATGKEGVDLFVGGGFDAVLTDMKLPDINGLDIVSILTEMDAQVPVVVMTGYGTMDSALEAMRRGARDYVEKPFEVDEVVRALHRAISERRMSLENRRLRALVERRLSPSGYETVEAELDALRPSDRDPQVAHNGGLPGARVPLLPLDAEGGPLPLREAQRRFEVSYVEDLLARTGGNVAAAARIAGISRPNFHKKLRTLDVDSHRFKHAARRGRTHDL